MLIQGLFHCNVITIKLTRTHNCISRPSPDPLLLLNCIHIKSIKFQAISSSASRFRYFGFPEEAGGMHLRKSIINVNDDYL